MSAVVVIVVLMLVAEAIGVGICLAYWHLWGRARFDRWLDRAVDDEMSRHGDDGERS